MVDSAAKDAAPLAFLTKSGLTDREARIAISTDAGRDKVDGIMKAFETFGADPAPLSSTQLKEDMRAKGLPAAIIEGTLSSPDPAPRVSHKLDALASKLKSGPAIEFMVSKGYPEREAKLSLVTPHGAAQVRVMMEQHAFQESLTKKELADVAKKGWNAALEPALWKLR